MRIARIVAGLLLGFIAITMLSGCGSSNYDSTFKAVVPASWTLVSSSGKISNSCNGGPGCGNVSRTYQMNTSAQEGAAQLAHQLETHGCSAQVQGNGISSDCTTGVHLAVSFTDTQASITLTKDA